MMPAFIHSPTHLMLGTEVHFNLPFPGTVPPFPSLHVTGHFLNGFFPGTPVIGSQPFLTEKVMTYIGPPMAKDTDIGMLLPHFPIPPLNILLPLIMLGSSSKNQLGSSTVVVGGKPIATSMPSFPLGVNLGCSDPISLPVDFVVAPHTVQAGLTWSDIISASLNMLASMALDIVFNKVKILKNSQASEHLGNFMKRSSIYKKIRASTYRQIREGYERTSKEAFEIAEEIGSSVSGKMAGLLTGYTEKGITTASGLPATSAKGGAGKVANTASQKIGDIYDGKKVEFF